MRDDVLHGIFAKLNRLDLFEEEAHDLYDAGFADFWNAYAGSDVSDIPLFERLLASPDAHVLDLACGAGRIGIALARGGVRVDGVELSPAMLALARRNLEAETAAVRERLRFFQGDMCTFAAPRRYDLVILGVTSLCLLLDAAQRLSLFRQVRRYLAPGGRFIFDILDFSGERWRQFDHFMDVLSREDEHGHEFAIVGQRVFPETRTFSVNVYRETIAWNGDTARALGISLKAWLETAEVTQALAASGLALHEQFDHGGTRYFVCQDSEAPSSC